MNTNYSLTGADQPFRWQGDFFRQQGSLIAVVPISRREACDAVQFTLMERRPRRKSAVPNGPNNPYEPVNGKLQVICNCGTQMIWVPVKDVGVVAPKCFKELAKDHLDETFEPIPASMYIGKKKNKPYRKRNGGWGFKS